jgi:lipopolysaccharide heptosyltransferase II
LDGLIIFDGKHDHKNFFGLMTLGQKLRKYRFDIVVDFQNNRRSHWLSFLSFARENYGFKRGLWGFLKLNGVKDVDHSMQPVPHQFLILEKLGILYNPSMFLELWPSEQDKKYVNELLESEWLGNVTNIVGINVAASSKWGTKNWPVESMAKLCDLLSAQNIRIVLTGMEKDKLLARHLMSLTKAKPADLTGKTDVTQLAALISRCRAYVTPDSAPMHVAAAMGTPFVAFFGPTSSARHLPPARKMRVIEKKPSCAPCYSSECKVKTHECMTTISPEEVAHRIKELME